MLYVNFGIGDEKEHYIYLKDVSDEDRKLLKHLGFEPLDANNGICMNEPDVETWVKYYGIGSIMSKNTKTFNFEQYFKTLCDKKEKNKVDFIKDTKKWAKEADERVLEFIFDFAWHKSTNEVEYEQIRSLFMDGYCYYFATILKTAFVRGEICWCAPYGHFIWMDVNGVPYDIEGVSTAEAEYYIPEKYIAEGIADFKHVPGVSFNATKEYINDAIERYTKDIFAHKN